MTFVPPEPCTHRCHNRAMPRRGGPKHKPDTRDRTRAAEALRLRLSGMTWEEIAAQLNYRGRGGPRMAVERLLSRVEHEGAAALRAVEGRRLDELQASVWSKATSGDCDAIRTVLRISERRSKLFGLDAPIMVGGLSEAEFGRMAAELLEVTGPKPLYALAGLPAPPEPVLDTYDDEMPWSNLGGPEPLYAAPAPVSGTLPYPGGEGAYPGGEGAAADESEAVSPVEDDESEEILAEIVDDDVIEPLPPAQRRLPASEVLNADGVPISRTGIARRLSGYDPLAAWRPG